jgi:hypothetical protein
MGYKSTFASPTPVCINAGFVSQNEMEENARFLFNKSWNLSIPFLSNKCSTGLHRPLQNISENAVHTVSSN